MPFDEALAVKADLDARGIRVMTIEQPGDGQWRVRAHAYVPTHKRNEFITITSLAVWLRDGGDVEPVVTKAVFGKPVDGAPASPCIEVVEGANTIRQPQWGLGV